MRVSLPEAGVSRVKIKSARLFPSLRDNPKGSRSAHSPVEIPKRQKPQLRHVFAAVRDISICEIPGLTVSRIFVVLVSQATSGNHVSGPRKLIRANGC